MAKQNRSETRKTRSENMKAMFSPDERQSIARTSQRIQFDSLCKTWEYKSQMNLLKEVINICSKETRRLEIEIGYTGIRTDVVYQYREIKSNKPNCGLISGWKNVVDFLEIQKGDRVYFEGRPDMPWLLCVSMDKNCDDVNVEDEYRV